jgi:AraC family transcriptional activator of pobA
MAGDLTVDRLNDPGAGLQVVFMRDASVGSDAERGARAPHRHDYHELIWTRAGAGEHLVDGEPTPVEPGTIVLIGRGQVHTFQRGHDLDVAVVRFGDELLSEGWLLGARGARVVAVPPPEEDRLASVVDALHAESRRPLDGRSVDLQRHLLAALLLWIERWYDAGRTRQREADDAEVQLYRRFVQVLERDFARHHEATHYADELAVPPAALSKSLTHVTGKATKELVLERVMLEAARLLRFTDLTVGEVAFRVGYDDQLYFSRAFKRRFGEPPMAYRQRLRGVVHT